MLDAVKKFFSRRRNIALALALALAAATAAGVPAPLANTVAALLQSVADVVTEPELPEDPKADMPRIDAVDQSERR